MIVQLCCTFDLFEQKSIVQKWTCSCDIYSGLTKTALFTLLLYVQADELGVRQDGKPCPLRY